MATLPEGEDAFSKKSDRDRQNHQSDSQNPGQKTKSLNRLAAAINALPEAAKARLAIENDDRTFSPADLLPVCRITGVPLTYDVHHHRCLPDGLSEGGATRAALETWHREPLFHLSSPLDRFAKGTDRRHADYIDMKDFPVAWLGLDITVDVEAKAKELAVEKLKKDLQQEHAGALNDKENYPLAFSQ